LFPTPISQYATCDADENKKQGSNAISFASHKETTQAENRRDCEPSSLSTGIKGNRLTKDEQNDAHPKGNDW
jgi:hypothetical protein